MLDIDEVFSDPNTLHRQMLVEVDHPRFGKMKQIGFPIKFSEMSTSPGTPTPRYGENTVQILASLGYDNEKITQLREASVIE